MALTRTHGLTIADLETMPDDGRTYVHWDRVAKRQAYAESGIEHYWLLDTRPSHERFTALRLASDVEAEHRDYAVVYDSTSTIEVVDPVAVSTPLVALFEPRG